MPTDEEQLENYAKSQSAKELVGGNKPQEKGKGSEELQKTDEVKAKLKKTLLGMEEQEKYDEEKGEWVTVLVNKPEIEPMCNRQGLEDFWSIVEPIVSETAAGSNLSGKDVAQEGFQAMRSVAESIMVKHKQYEIKNVEDASLIIQALNAACKNNLKKAEDARLLEHHEQSEERKVFRTENPDSSSGGLSSYNPFS